MSAKVEMFGLRLWKDGFDAALQALESSMSGRGGAARIAVTPNVDHLVRLRKNTTLLEKYKMADFIFPDGFPIVASSRLLGKGIKGRVTGADLFPALCTRVAAKKGKVFVLGGRPGMEAMIEEKLSSKYPELAVRAYAPSYGFSAESMEGRLAASMVNEFRPDVVFVCLGMPKQEEWAFRYRNEIDAGLVLCVGAALEFDIGLSKRAPKVVQTLCMEWLWRLCMDPARLWKRYLVADMAFIGLLLREIGAVSLKNGPGR